MWYWGRTGVELQAACGLDDVQGKSLGGCLQRGIPGLVEIVGMGEVVEVPEEVFKL